MTERSFFAELKRRNVIKASAAYLALGWVVTQITATVAPMLHLPEWVGPLVLWIGVIGFPFVLMFSWVYEITAEGIKRESEVARDASITHVTGRRLDYAIVGMLALAVVLFAIDRFVTAPRRETARAVASQAEPSAAAAPARVVANPGIPTIEADPSIAVLPLVNMSDDKANEYFSDGISEELLNLLAKVPKLRVIARTSSFGYKGKDTPIPEIARALNVASVLEGSVRKSADKVRITVQLIRASDSSHLWSETYDRKLDDIFKVQDEIAAAVVEQLKIKLLGAVPTVKPVDARVYPLILQAGALTDQNSREGRAQAIEVYRQALALAPNEARAWAGLSRTYLNQALFGEAPVAETANLSKDAANKALALDPDMVEAISALARLAADFELDLATSVRLHQRAIELEPANLTSLNALAVSLMYMGRLEEARRLFEYRVAHDPANPTAHNNLGNVLYVARRWDDAIESLRTSVRLSPEYVGARASIAFSLLLGRHDAAGALKELESEPDEVVRMAGMPMALHALGREPDADAALRALVDKYGKDQPEYVASTFAYLGRADAAFEWLDKAAAIHDPGVPSVPRDPLFDSLHGDARWPGYLRRIGYAPEQLAKIDLKVKLPE